MSLYAVQDNVGNYWDFDNRGFHSPQNNARRNTTFNLALADAIVQMNGGNVVELVEKPAPEVVSEAEAEMLEQATCDDDPAELIVGFVNSHDKYDDYSKTEDRLMRAYVNGWTVAKDKKYNVKVPLVQAQGGLWFLINASGKLDATYIQDLAKKFSREEINAWGLQDCERKEVSKDDD